MDDKVTEQNYLYKKIDSIEHRLETHVTKIEQRLDQLVHIMTSVASLQEREARNADAIKDIRITLKDSLDSFMKAIDRIHVRLDEVKDAQEQESLACRENDKDLGSKIRQVDSEVSKWRDRGIGLWLGVSLLVLFVQGYGGMVLNSYIEEFKQTKYSIQELGRKQQELSQEMDKITLRLGK